MDWNGLAYACTLAAIIALAYVLYDGLIAARQRPPTVAARPRVVRHRAVRPARRPVPPVDHIDRAA